MVVFKPDMDWHVRTGGGSGWYIKITGIGIYVSQSEIDLRACSVQFCTGNGCHKEEVEMWEKLARREPILCALPVATGTSTYFK